MSKQLQRIKAFIDTHPELPIDPDAVQPGTYKWPPHFQPLLVLYVFLGGCAGAYMRYLVGLALPPSNGWPVATITVNLLGAFVLGFLLEGLARLGDDKGILRAVRLFVGTGFIGAFTTYSTFAVDINSLANSHLVAEAAEYMLATLAGGVILAGLGIQVAARHHVYKEKQA